MGTRRIPRTIAKFHSSEMRIKSEIVTFSFDKMAEPMRTAIVPFHRVKAAVLVNQVVVKLRLSHLSRQ
jgi:hypothetical protein